MEIAENLFLGSLDKLEKYLKDDFKLLSTNIKKATAPGLMQSTSPERSDLIQLLQYQDVIGQKIQHLKKINTVFDEEIKNLHLEKVQNDIIPDLLLLMVKLTRLVKDEYTKVVIRIRCNFNKLEIKNSWMEENFRPFYEEILVLLHMMEFFNKQVKEQYIDSTEAEIESFHQKLQAVHQSFSMNSERKIFKSVMHNRISTMEHQAEEENSVEPGDVDLF